MPEGGFLPSSPLLLPASEGERWMPDELLEGTLPFSEAFASSVLPVKVHKSKNITNHRIICTRSLPYRINILVPTARITAIVAHATANQVI